MTGAQASRLQRRNGVMTTACSQLNLTASFAAGKGDACAPVAPHFMESLYYEDQVFDGLDLPEENLTDKEIESCEFLRCDFSKSDFSGTVFVDCVFRECNLSLVKLSEAALKTVDFSDCKLVGVDFGKCSDFLFTVSFQNCQLDYSSFFQKKLKSTRFADCSLKETDFTSADLTSAVFHNCDLLRASFVQTNLEKADFRTAFNYGLDPELNRVKGAKFSHAGIAGLLTKYQIVIQ
ncbi:MAG: pentapeptide repeat-containing protein [Pyrinomonadaceae bacterium]